MIVKLSITLRGSRINLFFVVQTKNRAKYSTVNHMTHTLEIFSVNFLLFYNIFAYRKFELNPMEFLKLGNEEKGIKREIHFFLLLLLFSLDLGCISSSMYRKLPLRIETWVPAHPPQFVGRLRPKTQVCCSIWRLR